MGPYFTIAKIAYSEQEGKNLQEGLSSGETND